MFLYVVIAIMSALWENAATLIKKLFEDRKKLLQHAGICLSERELLSMYGLEDMDI